jgi:hypothetical protein
MIVILELTHAIDRVFEDLHERKGVIQWQESTDANPTETINAQTASAGARRTGTLEMTDRICVGGLSQGRVSPRIHFCCMDCR